MFADGYMTKGKGGGAKHSGKRRAGSGRPMPLRPQTASGMPGQSVGQLRGHMHAPTAGMRHAGPQKGMGFQGGKFAARPHDGSMAGTASLGTPGQKGTMLNGRGGC